jgi:glutamate-1-semialdehyde 2,1-aminomutase
MNMIAPLGPVYQAGTLSGNPIAVRAGIYVLEYLKKNPAVYEAMDDNLNRLRTELSAIAGKYGVPYQINHTTGMFTGFFSDRQVNGYDDALASNRAMHEKFFKMMLDEGIFFAPSPFEASFLTASHGQDEITKTIGAYERVFKSLRG